MTEKCIYRYRDWWLFGVHVLGV